MTTLTKTLNLHTSYELTGNSSGTPIDTLGIAFDFGDSNDMYDHAIDYIFETVDYAKKSWLQSDCEDFFHQTLDNETIEKYAADLSLYETALANYKTTFDDVTSSEHDGTDAQKALSNELERAESDYYDTCYDEWLHGDSDSFGLIDTVTNYFRDYNIEIDVEKNGDVTATISDSTLQLLVEDNEIEETTVDNNDTVFEWISHTINSKAYTVHDKNKTELEKRRAERDRVAQYKKEQKEKADANKITELLALKK